MRQAALTWSVIACAATAATVTAAHAADGLEVSFDAGRVTVVANDVPLATILDEWARLGNTTFVDADRLSGPPVSVEMVDVPELEALRVLLRAVDGYVAAPRAAGQPGASAYDRVLIMATARRRPPRPPVYTPASGGFQEGEPEFDDTAPPGLVPEPADPELDQLELLEQLRNRYQRTQPPPDLFSQPGSFPSTQPDKQGEGGLQTTPRPGMVTTASGQAERPGRRRAIPVRPQTDDR